MRYRYSNQFVPIGRKCYSSEAFLHLRNGFIVKALSFVFLLKGTEEFRQKRRNEYVISIFLLHHDIVLIHIMKKIVNK
ncbi:hypothetical protein ABE42_18300 [Bacillus thuringiensis]|nr:hypothetical protein [Bacillus thuringiensis]